MSTRSADEIRADIDRIEAFGPGHHIPDETRRLVADVEPLLAERERLQEWQQIAKETALTLANALDVIGVVTADRDALRVENERLKR